MDYQGLEDALKGHVSDALETLTAIPVLEWFGVPSNPRARTHPFVMGSIRYGITQSAQLGPNGKNEVNGVVFLNVYNTAQVDTTASLVVAKAVLDYTPKGLRLNGTYGDIILKVGYVETALSEAQYTMTPISLPFVAYLEV